MVRTIQTPVPLANGTIFQLVRNSSRKPTSLLKAKVTCTDDHYILDRIAQHIFPALELVALSHLQRPGGFIKPIR
jgi:hypothetical protein